MSIGLGTTELNIQTMDALGLLDPLTNFQEFSQSANRADGLASGLGWSLIAWRWGFMTLTDRAILKAYCTGKSAQVYIASPKNDGTTGTFRAVMIWPDTESINNDITNDLQISFRVLEEITA